MKIFCIRFASLTYCYFIWKNEKKANTDIITAITTNNISEVCALMFILYLLFFYHLIVWISLISIFASVVCCIFLNYLQYSLDFASY